MKASLPFLLVVGSALAEAPSFEPWSVTERSLFPSAIISTATVEWDGAKQSAEDKANDVPLLGDQDGWLGVALSDVPAGAKVTVEVSVDGFMKPSKWTGTVEEAYPVAQVFPRAKWDFAALQTVREQQPVVATFKVTINGEELEEQTENCVIRSINDCPFYVLWDEEGKDFSDFSCVFAAYVNENHPWVDGILKDALKSGLVSSFSGYQSGNPEDVITQVFAVWNVLQRRGIKYSDISTTTPSRLVVSQTVRFLDDSLEGSQANCVDGSVLMASILRKIGLDVHLVMVPGHCFLAFRLANTPTDDLLGEDSDLVGLETTMLGNDNLKPAKDLPKMAEKLKKEEFEASFKTFESAIGVGTQNIAEHKEAFESGDNPNTQLISIKEARELGVMPIASGKTKKN